MKEILDKALEDMRMLNKCYPRRIAKLAAGDHWQWGSVPNSKLKYRVDRGLEGIGHNLFELIWRENLGFVQILSPRPDMGWDEDAGVDCFGIHVDGIRIPLSERVRAREYEIYKNITLRCERPSGALTESQVEVCRYQAYGVLSLGHVDLATAAIGLFGELEMPSFVWWVITDLTRIRDGLRQGTIESEIRGNFDDSSGFRSIPFLKTDGCINFTPLAYEGLDIFGDF